MQVKSKLLAALTAATLSFTTLSLPVSANSRGDVDGDGKITLNDAYRALMAYANGAAGMSSGLTNSQWNAADADLDGSLTINDAYQILMYYAMESAGQTPSWDALAGLNAPETSSWQDLYSDLLWEYLYEYDRVACALYPMNYDTVPELAIIAGTCEVDKELLFYTVENGETRLIGSNFSGFHAGFYEDTARGQFCIHGAQMGLGWIHWFQYDGTEVERTRRVDEIDICSTSSASDSFDNYGSFAELPQDYFYYSSYDGGWTTYSYDAYGNERSYEGVMFSALWNYN